MAHCFVPLQSVHGFASSVGFVCVNCFCYAGNKRRREEQGKKRCKPMEARIARHVRVASQVFHDVHVATSTCGRPLHACRACGAYSARQFRKLLQPCPGVVKPRPYAWRCIFEQGRHPNNRGMQFSKFMRVKLPQVFDPDVFDLGWVFGAEQVKTKEASHTRSFCPPNASASHLATGAAAADKTL